MWSRNSHGQARQRQWYWPSPSYVPEHAMTLATSHGQAAARRLLSSGAGSLAQEPINGNVPRAQTCDVEVVPGARRCPAEVDVVSEHGQRWGRGAGVGVRLLVGEARRSAVGNKQVEAVRWVATGPRQIQLLPGHKRWVFGAALGECHIVAPGHAICGRHEIEAQVRVRANPEQVQRPICKSQTGSGAARLGESNLAPPCEAVGG